MVCGRRRLRDGARRVADVGAQGDSQRGTDCSAAIGRSKSPEGLSGHEARSPSDMGPDSCMELQLSDG